MNMLKTAAIATAFAASLIPLSAMLVQSCGKPLSTSQTGEGLVLNYRIRGSGNTNVTVNGRGLIIRIEKIR